MINNTNDKYYQVFLLNNSNIYPLELYHTVFKTLKSLDDIFKQNLNSSCIVNDSNILGILRPLLNMYKAVRPYRFVNNLDEGMKFILSHNL